MRLFSSRRRAASQNSTRRRPHFEMLEDRCLLSAGALDPTFGTNGTVTTNLSGGQDTANAIAPLPDGKMLVAGGTDITQNSGDFVLLRYNSDGSLDNSFGTGGAVTTDFSRGMDSANSLVVQPDGNIILVGYSSHQDRTSGTWHPQLALARYHADGTLDTSFGKRGQVLTDLSMVEGAIEDVALQSDGKIVVSGGANTSTGGHDFLVARYNADGTLDNSFGTGGVAVTDLGGTDVGYALVIQDDGKIVAAGDSGQYTSTLVRYNTDGTLDSNFGNGGIVTTAVAGSQSLYNNILIDAQGRLVAGGWYHVQPNSSAYGFLVARYTSAGSLDPSFGTNGQVELAGDPSLTDNDYVETSMALDANGKLVLGGDVTVYEKSTVPPEHDFVLTRISEENGSLDTNFGNAGWVETSVGGPGSLNHLYGVGIQPDGKIVAAGNSTIYDTNSQLVSDSIGLARYLGDPPPPIIGISDVALAEGNSGQTNFVFTVTRSGDTSQAISVDYATADGTATTADSDYVATGGTLNFAAGETSKTITVLVNGDTTQEPDETFYVNLSNASTGVQINDAQGVGTIINDDGGSGGGGHGKNHLTATALGSNSDIEPLTVDEVQPLLQEAIVRLAAAGANVSSLGNVQIKITSLPGTTLGMAAGNTIFIDSNAAGWGWFVDATPWDDSEFTTPGDQGEMNHMDLLSAVEHELGHILGYVHEEDGFMSPTLAPGERFSLTSADVWEQALFALAQAQNGKQR